MGSISLLAGQLRNFGQAFLQLKYLTQVFILSVIVLLKVGLTFLAAGSVTYSIPASQALPEATGYYSASIGHLAIARVLGADTQGEWLLLHSLLFVLALGTGVFLARKSPLAPSSIILILIASSTAVAATMSSIGNYDPITLFGALVFMLARRLPNALVGAVIMSLGNPEQALLAVFALLLLSATSAFGNWRRRSVWALPLVFISWAVIQVWIMLSDTPSRFEVLPYFFAQSLGNLILRPNGAIWSWLGVGWLIIVASLLLLHKSARKVFLLALLVPILATIATVDGARVFGLIAFPLFLAIGIWLWGRLSESPQDLSLATGIYLALWIAIPIGLGSLGNVGEFVAWFIRVRVSELTGGV